MMPKESRNVNGNLRSKVRNTFTLLPKSIVRLVAGGLLSLAGYIPWIANNYTDIFIADPD